ncbi:MAG: aliphatic sulfonate ABC transporter substrate-binding protein [Deltaproteobacteria bacterium]|nr:aliphatic sulfonate ABC transporter substrate-binding protein [Deltaproteobacteria bacterium]
MTKRSFHEIKPWAIIGLALLIGGFWLPSPAAASGKLERVTVVYGGSSWLGHYPVWVGIKKGIFQEKGLGVLFQQFYASSGRMGSLIAGDLDFASTGSISAIALMAAGVKRFYAIGTQDSYATVEGIIATKGITSIGDLKGKKLAVTFASSAHVLVLDILKQEGLDPKQDIRLINLKVSEMPAAFKSGEVDACAAWTPVFNRLLAMEGAHLLLNDTRFSLFKEFGLGPGPDVLVVRKAFSEKYPNTTQAFIKGYFQSVSLLKNQPEACAKVLTELTQLDLKEQIKVLKDITWYPLDMQRKLMLQPGSFVAGLQRLADFLYANGQIDRSPRVKDWIHGDLLP